MKHKNTRRRKQNFGFFTFIINCTLFLFLFSCTEDTVIEVDTFENLLVIDASISNEMKKHEVLLTRTYRFEEAPSMESGATVKVLGNGFEYKFIEGETGSYISEDEFSASLNVEYKLQITTKDGKVYSSSNEKLTTIIEIDDLYVQRIINDDGVDGIALLVDSYDPSNTSKYYRYEYEETFMIVAPMWVSEDAYVIGNECPRCIVGLRERSENTRVCYRTEVSNQQNLLENESLDTDRVDGHVVNFLASTDYKISHRYSLRVKQFVVSKEAYIYYKTLEDFSSEGSVFSQIQTGFVEGNIYSEDNSNEKVIGYFDVNSVSEKRVFFNYRDYYPGVNLPDYPILCSPIAPALQGEYCPGPCGPLTTMILNDAVSYLDDYTGIPAFQGETGPYLVVSRACGDCTVLGTNEMPDFWIE